jgi:predicted secreted hydrolase
MRRIVLFLALALAVAFAVGRWPRQPREQDAQPLAARLELADLLGGAAADGFSRADRPRDFRFPDDHGPHDGFRTEWWYLTGQLADDDGRAFGYQLTFFRQALAPVVAPSVSRWRTGHLWMAHFALTDVGGRRFHAFERFGREALGLAGAERTPLKIHVEDWEFAATGADATAFRLAAAEGGVALALDLAPARPPVLQGDGGLSAKGPEPGNASYYYSLTRLVTRGEVQLGARRFAVTGSSWLDREWSTSALGPDLAGWDWFALELDDGSDLMLYRLRRPDGAGAPASSGTWIAADGATTRLAARDFVLTPLTTWRSPRGGDYPARWRIEIPSRALSLELEPLLADQELPLSVRYWEGAVVARGTAAGRPVTGRGYVELTGYAAAPPAR